MFPFQDQISFHDCKLTYKSRDVLEHVWPLLTPERKAKIDKVLPGRCFSNVLVMENIYDRGNISAVMRSAEAMGFVMVHMIELGEAFKESQRTTAGADKWVEVKKWKSTKDCVRTLKDQGKQIIVTHLSADSRPLSEIDFSKPSALVLGNEKEGVSREMIEAADHRVVIPMSGFVQSYNISVAGALCLYQMYQSRMQKLSKVGDLSLEQLDILKAIYSVRTLDSSQDILKAKVKIQ